MDADISQKTVSRGSNAPNNSNTYSNICFLVGDRLWNANLFRAIVCIRVEIYYEAHCIIMPVKTSTVTSCKPLVYTVYTDLLLSEDKQQTLSDM